MSDIIEIQNLHVQFQEDHGILHAVNGVDLTVHQGETLAIVGESGSGKSVTTHALLGLLGKDATVTTDAMRLADVDLTHATPRDFAGVRGRLASLIFQDPLSALNPTMRIGRQIGEALTVWHHPSRTALRQAVLDAIADVELPDPAMVASKYPHELSGGQRQRVMIAQALIAQPRVLIADEPTTALDVTLQAQVLALIQAQKAKRDLSVVFITHDLGVVANIADRVAIMYAGQIVEVGTATEIFYHPQHPYTWGLLDAVPDDTADQSELFTLPGTPPDMHQLPVGDPFAPRNPQALAIDYQQAPPVFAVTPTHRVRSWLLDPRTPPYQPPASIQRRWARYAAIMKEASHA
ncbi:ABC transporter ATP-binding protein [Lacticaseibacillus suihuaensis]